MSRPEYQWDIKNVIPELVVGSEAQRKFKQWVWENHGFHTRMRLTTLKKEYLEAYLEEYKSVQVE